MGSGEKDCVVFRPGDEPVPEVLPVEPRHSPGRQPYYSPEPDRIERIDFLETMVSKERLDGARARVAEAEARLEVTKVRLEQLERDHARIMRELGAKYQMPEGTTVLEDGRIVRI